MSLEGGLHSGLCAFVGGGIGKGDEVEHFAKAAADAEAVNLFDFGAAEVGGHVGDHFATDK